MAGLKTKPEYNGLAEAVSLGIALLKKAKQNTWSELVEAMGAGNLLVIKAFKAVDLTDAQLDTVNTWQPVLNLVKVAPPVIPVICPMCGHYILTGDTAPSKCMVTAGCEGKPFKVAVATGITATKTPAGAKAPATAAEVQEEAPVAAPAAKAPPSAKAAAKASAADVEFFPEDSPEPTPATEAEPPAGPSPEEESDPAPVREPYLDVVIVPDDVDPFA